MMTTKEISEFEQTYSESKIQHICVCWFRATFPFVANLMFAVPNGGPRFGKSGYTMKYEGATKGVADLILLFPSCGKASLCIEMKTPKKKGRQTGKQSEEQQLWQNLVEKYNNTYVVCHGLIEFITEVCNYLRVKSEPYINKVLQTYAIYR